MIARMRSTLRQAQDNDGFTLIEIVVALMISTVIFSAMAAAGIAGVRASVIARQNQNAVDVLNRLVEEARTIDYAELAMVDSDLSVGDSAISTGGTPTYSVPGIGSEEVWSDATGSVNPHVETVTAANGVEYTTKTYVTVPAGYSLDTAGQPNQKRLTIVTSWESYGQERERTISTLMTETARGLPLPRYSVIPTSPLSQTKTPSSNVTFGFQVVNRGARDTFNISASSGTWTLRVDTDCNGQRDTGETTTLTNTDSALGDTRLDTGPLQPNNYPPYCVVATRFIDSTETGTSTVTFNLESSAQPSADGADVSSPTYTVNVTTGSTGGTPTPTATGYNTICEPVPPITGTPFGFRNGTTGTNGATTSQLVNLMTENTCLNQDPANYSTEAGSGTGRSLTTGGSATASSAAQRAEWRWNPSATRRVTVGTAYVSVLVSCPAVGSSVTLNAALGLYRDKNASWTQSTSGSQSVSCATANAWTRVEIPMSVGSQITVQNKYQGQPEYLSVRLWVTGGTAGQQLRLNYENGDAKSFFYARVT